MGDTIREIDGTDKLGFTTKVEKNSDTRRAIDAL